jgi:hypothetical protein
MKPWLTRNWLPLAAFGVALFVLCATAGERLRRGSTDPHYVAQAAAWLQGKTALDEWPPGADDPAKVEEVALDDGTLVRGRRITSRNSFRLFGGKELPLSRVKETVRTIQYVSFPPVPSLIFLPQAALHGVRANDVFTTALLAAMVPAFLLVLFRRLREEKLSVRRPSEEVWLAALLTFGSVFYFSAVQGRVWFTAHVVAVLLAVLYLWAAIGARRPVLAGLFLALAVGTRPPMLFMGLVFVVEAWRLHPEDRWRRLTRFAIPIAVIGLALVAYNMVRFGEPTEFGHSYLAVRQQAQIEKYGLFSLHYVSRNLAVALALLPELSTRFPFVSISGHGMALWLTTPALVLLAWPRERNRLHRVLWLCVALTAAWSLCYQNSGWVQFGYRFSLDYMVLLVVLLAIGARPLTPVCKALIIAGIVINLFGAITFHRFGSFYRSDNKAYETVIAH